MNAVISKYNHKQVVVLLVCALVILCGQAHGQYDFDDLTSGTPLNASTPVLDLDNQTPLVKKAVLKIGVGFTHAEQPTYPFGDIPFEGDVTVGLDFSVNDQNGVLVGDVPINVEFSLNELQPEQIYYKDITDQVADLLSDPLYDPGIVYVELIGNQVGGFVNVSEVQAQVPALEAGIEEHLRMRAWIEYEYGIDVQGMPRPELMEEYHPFGPQPVLSRNNTMRFELNGWEAPAFELQMLRVYNEDPLITFTYDPRQIRSQVRWENALSYVIDRNIRSFGTSLQVEVPPIIEGSGYYLWRIRPVGSLYPGGASDPRNVMDWSSFSDVYGIQTGELTQVTVVAQTFAGSGANLDMSDPVPTDAQVFYFEDPEPDTNWSFQRSFTENTSSNAMTIADPLLREVQTLAVHPSEEKLVVSPSVVDLAGRSSFSPMSVTVDPGTEGIEGRLSNVLQDEFGGVYDHLDFDVGAQVDSPHLIEDVTSPYSYYNGTHEDGVADGEGYLFGRTLFETDGTGRIREASMPGRHFALDYEDDFERKHTMRYWYGSATEAELIAIFGREAPLASRVQKVYTCDPNQTVTVEYISSEGNVIATALVNTYEGEGEDPSFENHHLLPLDETSGIEGTVDDIIAGNIELKNGLFSGRRYVLTDRTNELSLEYAINCLTYSADCGDAPCEYQLQLKVIGVDTEGQLGYEGPYVYYAHIHDLGVCEEDEVIQIQEFYHDPEYTDLATSDGIIALSDLPMGTYTVEKRLYLAGQDGQPVDDLGMYVGDAGSLQEDILNGVGLLVAAWLDEDDAIGVVSDMVGWGGAIDLTDPSHPVYTQALSFAEVFPEFGEELPSGTVLDLSISEDLNVLLLSTACCGVVEIPLYDNEENVTSCGDWGIEGVEMTSMWCLAVEALDNIPSEQVWDGFDAEAMVVDIMAPYTEESFKQLITNMLAGGYTCGDEDAAYDAAELENCWQSVVEYMVNVVSNSDVGSGGMNPFQQPEEDNDVDVGEEGGSTIDDNLPGWLEWLLGIDPDDVVPDAAGEDFSTADTDGFNMPFHPMVMFLQCTGFRFETALTSSEMAAESLHFIENESSLPPGLELLTGLDQAHRYFEYEEGGCLWCEFIHCYLGSDGYTCDPFNPHCADEDDPGNLDWNCSQWEVFYYCVRNGCSDPTPVEGDCAQLNPFLPDNLLPETLGLQIENRELALSQAVSGINGCEAHMASMVPAITDQLEMNFQENGWQVVDCVSAESPCEDISIDHINQLAESVIANLQAQCRVGLSVEAVEDLEELQVQVEDEGYLLTQEDVLVLEGNVFNYMSVSGCSDFIPSFCEMLFDPCVSDTWTRLYSWELHLEVPLPCPDATLDELDPWECEENTDAPSTTISATINIGN